jgi:excisionase family DNA binding protein
MYNNENNKSDDTPVLQFRQIQETQPPAAVTNQITAPSYYFKEALSVEEASEYTGLSAGTLYILAHERRIPFYKPLVKKVYFKKGELDAFMFRNKRPADYEVSEQADAILNGETIKSGYKK